jgi:RimJ/RimL family protein N-acetyltransferase
VIETERLILRRWRDEDRAPYAAMMTDRRVTDWLSGAQTRAESDATIDRLNAEIAEHGFGFYAAERKADGRLAGAIGLQLMGAGMPGEGEIELAWRLHPDAQGAGLATEGAAACRDWAFSVLDAPQVIAVTAQTNLRSQAVMRRIGMIHDPALDFDHPRLAEDHPLRRHVLFVARR